MREWAGGREAGGGALGAAREREDGRTEEGEIVRGERIPGGSDGGEGLMAGGSVWKAMIRRN